MSKKGIYFYSNKCNNCNKLNPYIQQYLNILHIYCVDELHVRKHIPQTVKLVPTLIINGNNTPIVGDDIYTWLKQQQQNNVTNNHVTKQTTSINHDNNTKLNPNKQQDTEPLGICMEMSGSNFSDNYSFIDNQKPLEHAFQFIDTMNTNSIQHIQEPPKKKSDEITNKMEQFVAQRDLELKPNKPPMYM